VPTRTERSPHPPCVCVVRRRGIHCVFTGFLLARVQRLREISVFKSQSPLIATFYPLCIDDIIVVRTVRRRPALLLI